MRVEVFAAGDHDHADPKGAGELIEMLLQKAGYNRQEADARREEAARKEGRRTPAPPPPVDMGKLLREFAPKAQDLADAGRRLEAIEQQREELRKKLAELDGEYNRIAEQVKNFNIHPAILSMMRIDVPMHGKNGVVVNGVAETKTSAPA